jgi:hypothetical protein
MKVASTMVAFVPANLDQNDVKKMESEQTWDCD